VTGSSSEATVSPNDEFSPSGIRVVLMRGGTSKGVFVWNSDLPLEGPERDEYILKLMGSPDPMQLDGLGGTHSSTSKLIAISRPQRPNVDVEYLFAQVAVDAASVDYKSNCGNLTSAVGVFAIEEGMVQVTEPITKVHLLNQNTNTNITAHIPVEDGHVRSRGDQYISGVPSPGAPIINEYLNPCGSLNGSTFPTGHRRQYVSINGHKIEVSIVDIAQPVVFVSSEEFGLSGHEPPADLNTNSRLLDATETLRGTCAVTLGLVKRSEQARLLSLTVPRLVLLAPGNQIRALSLSAGRFHHAIPVTGAICTAASVCLDGTLPNDIATSVDHKSARIEHPRGYIELSVQRGVTKENPIESVGVIRTARRLMVGTAYLP